MNLATANFFTKGPIAWLQTKSVQGSSGVFSCGSKNDVAAGTNFAQIMICRIQLIGNIASISDGKF